MRQVAAGYELAESPTWDANGKSLLFADTLGGGVYAYDEADGNIRTVVPHRKGIGGMTLHGDGGCVVSGRNVAWKIDGQTRPLLERPAGLERFNELVADSDGRIYAGSMAHLQHGESPAGLPPGYLHLLDLDGRSEVVAEGVRLPNGMACSIDGTMLYQADTASRRILAHHRHPDGSLGGATEVIAWSGPDDAIDFSPDGLALDEEGNLWVAIFGGGCVVVVDPNGTEQERIPVDQPWVTSVSFGGLDGRTLFVTTGSAPGQTHRRQGGLHRIDLGISGAPVPTARVVPPEDSR
jgi:gluconolactonase